MENSLPENKPAKAWIFFANFGYASPGGDLASRFGPAAEAGGGIWYKTATGYFFGIEAHRFFSSEVKETSILDAYINNNGVIIGSNGFEARYRLQQRGSKLPQIRFGKVIPWRIGRASYGSGIMLSVATGAFMHRIRILDDSRSIAQIDGDYVKGYDRFTLGPMVAQQVGYVYQDAKRRINFFLAFEATQALTINRRSLNFDTGTRDNRLRTDLQWMFKAGWFFPVYQNKPEEYYYY
jgi:hypothetical protein